MREKTFILYTKCFILENMQILAIETSCDDTAVALVKAEKGNFFVMDDYSADDNVSFFSVFVKHKSNSSCSIWIVFN